MSGASELLTSLAIGKISVGYFEGVGLWVPLDELSIAMELTSVFFCRKQF